MRILSWSGNRFDPSVPGGGTDVSTTRGGDEDEDEEDAAGAAGATGFGTAKSVEISGAGFGRGMFSLEQEWVDSWNTAAAIESFVPFFILNSKKEKLRRAMKCKRSRKCLTAKISNISLWIWNFQLRLILYVLLK